METKQEPSAVWSQADSNNTAQVHFEGGTVAQIVYSGDQADRGEQQVVYTADGNSYTSVEPAEHTLVYIHPADGTQVALSIEEEQLSNSLTAMPDMGDAPSSPLGTADSTDDYEEDEDEDSELDDWEPRQLEAFNPQNLWCEECNNANPSVCLLHGPLHPIHNRPVLSRARASLPLILYVDRFLGGVFSKRRIPKRTQFGPVEAPLRPQSELQDHYIHLKLCKLDAEKDTQTSDDLWFDLSDEDSCNWMMFVRPARNHLEQNLVAYQYGSELFYTTIKNIQPKQELKVWYAASYAEFVNQKIHDVTEEEIKVLREQEKNWPCYECNRRFVSSEQLQQHLNMHDDKLSSASRGRSRGRGRKRFGTGRRPGRPPKFIRLDPPADASEDKTTVEEASPVGETKNGGSTCALKAALGLSRQPFAFLQKQHVSSGNLSSPRQNAALQHLFIRKSFRPFKCPHCGKAFRDKDKLEQHLRVHGRDAYTFACHICSKSFLSDSSLEDHLLLHAENRSFSCLLCPETFERVELLKEHVEVHSVDGAFTCPSCKKTFSDFIQVKKHIRCFHSEKIFQCPDCEKAFCRPDKLRLHMLRHSDRKDFLCSTCGKQFKRKDKLREHMQRMHNPDREAKKADRIHRSKSLKMKVPTSDFESFVFKCRLCMMGFRRRGMLVNHLSKRHPEMRIDDVPELTLPIIKPNRDYFCQYCDKVYKSASKRKAHILKNHPGAELPPSIRKLRPAAPGEPDPMLSTHTQLTGTIATSPVCCPHCAKQYSSKTKMVQHIRKKHPELAQLGSSMTAAVISSAPAVINADGATAEAVVTTDLLTQAMTELSQTLTTDYRTAQGDYQRIQYIPVSQAGGSLAQPQHIQLQVVQVAPASSPHSQAPTVDVSQLHDPHGYSQQPIQLQHVQVSEASGTGQGASRPLSPTSQQPSQELTPVTLAQSQSSSQQPGTVQHTYIPGNWNYRGYRESPPPVCLFTHYVISEGQSDLETKQAAPQSSAQNEHLEQQPVTQQYIITTTTNGSGTGEVHITKP
uniref:PR domain zinc finger protein 10 n=1 Tax=Oryzias melastigma TaxID=30732 RepID=A0A3B3B496_ORYME